MAASGPGRPPADQVQFGGQRPAWWSGRRGRGFAAVAFAVLLALAGYGLAVRQQPRQRPGQVTVIEVGHRLLDTPAGWELYGLGSGLLVRVQLALGRITITRFQALGSGRPAALVAGRDWALIRPSGNAPGYLVRPSRPASALAGPLLNGGSVLPGLAGRYGVAEVGPRGLIRLGISSLLAVGPGTVLGVSCRRPPGCRVVVVDTRTGRRHALARLDYDAIESSGAIAPDGEVAAVVQMRGGVAVLDLVNLASGAERTVLAPVGKEGLGPQALAWSPDSHWLFAALSDGRLVVINAVSGRLTLLGVHLPLVYELAVWPAGP